MVRQEREQAPDEGFTLIELLVVIIVIGVLAAIAIPSFMRHRDRAWDVAIKSDLRNAAMAQDALITAGPTGFYAGTVNELVSAGFRPSSPGNYFGGVFTLTVESTGSDYCITARSQSGNYFGFSSFGGPVIKSTLLDATTCS